ncbi:MAG TPA: aminotransferase class V-fold PLP-dependent enzyme [Solirubrobacteraceae bacterium]|nr:aminotransferase class V-fold PLP-dependent enzyme [Solirubrobacteraceae bacterium]
MTDAGARSRHRAGRRWAPGSLPGRRRPPVPEPRRRRVHERAPGVDAAQLAPYRPLPATADFLAFSGHKMYAPYGAGAPGAGAADEGCQGSFT